MRGIFLPIVYSIVGLSVAAVRRLLIGRITCTDFVRASVSLRNTGL